MSQMSGRQRSGRQQSAVKDYTSVLRSNVIANLGFADAKD